MARWRQSDRNAPAELRSFDWVFWGPGQAGLDAGEEVCREWLAANPFRSLPFGDFGDWLDVIAEAARLQPIEMLRLRNEGRT